MKNLKNKLKFWHWWKPMLKTKRRKKIGNGIYTYITDLETPEERRIRKNECISFSIFNKCITIQIRKYPKGFWEYYPPFDIFIKRRN